MKIAIYTTKVFLFVSNATVAKFFLLMNSSLWVVGRALVIVKLLQTNYFFANYIFVSKIIINGIPRMIFIIV